VCFFYVAKKGTRSCVGSSCVQNKYYIYIYRYIYIYVYMYICVIIYLFVFGMHVCEVPSGPKNLALCYQVFAAVKPDADKNYCCRHIKQAAEALISL